MWKRIKGIVTLGNDEQFLGWLKEFERLIAKWLSVGMVLVILVTTIQLSFFLLREIFLTKPLGFSTNNVFEIFGLFLNVLIALEILENITAYLKKQVIPTELVIATSLIAVSRKIIILELSKIDGLQLIGLAIAILALSISYWIVRQSHPDR